MLLLITGRAGAGTTTLAGKLLGHFKDAQMLTSITTRSLRSSDLAGEYERVKPERFEELVGRNAFQWHFELYGNRYGTLEDAFRASIQRNTGLYVATAAMPFVMEILEHAHEYGLRRNVNCVFLAGASEKDLERRMLSRGDDVEEVATRLFETRTWEELAHHFRRTFHWVDCSQTPKYIMERVVTMISQPKVVY